MKEKYRIILFVPLFALVFAPVSSFAREDEPEDDSTIRGRAEVNIKADARTPKLLQNTEEREERMETRRAELQAKAEVRKTELRLKMEERMRRHAEWMVKRFNAALERLEKLAARIEARIAKLDSAGHDTAAAKASVAVARTEMAEAEANIIKLEAAFETAIENGERRPSFEEVRAIASSTRADLKSAHRALMDAVQKIKGLSLSDSSIKTEASAEAEVVQ